MAEEFKISLGVELSPDAANNLNSQIRNLNTNPIAIAITLDDRNIQNQLDNIRQQIQALGNIRINLGGGGRGTQRNNNEITQAYNDLMNLQRRINSIRITLSRLDANKNSSQIAELSSQLNRLMVDYNNLYQIFNMHFSTDQLDNLNRAFDIANDKVSSLNAKMSDTSDVQQVNNAYKELYNIGKQIDDIELKIAGLDDNANANEINTLTTQLNNLREAYAQLKTSLQGQLSTEQLTALESAAYETQDKIDQLTSKLSDKKNNFINSIKNTGISDFEKQFSNVELQLSKISSVSEEAQTSVNNFKLALDKVKETAKNGSTDELINDYKELQVAAKEAANQVKILVNEQTQAINAQKLQASKDALSADMDIWLRNNSAAAKDFGAKIEELKLRLASCDAVQLDGIKSEFQQVKKEAELAGKATQTFGDRFKTEFSKLSTYFSASMIISEAVRGLRDMYNNVVEVDTAMVELYRVSDLTETQYSDLYDNMTRSAKEYGVALTYVVTSTADWIKLGFDSSTASRLAEITTMYQHITDLDNDTAVENLITAYKGFQDQLLNLYNGDEAAAVEYVADVFNELGNNYAVSAEDVGEALTKCASALSLAGNSFQESAAMVTGIAEITQDADKAGSSIKVLSLRLRGMKGELQELGEEVDENVESVSKMQTQILNLTNGAVNIFNADGTFKSTYEIMDAIAEIYDTLSSTQQADLLETIAGKNRANDVAALISNWEQVEAAMQSATEAEGSAAKENEKYMDSIQGRLDTLTASWQALSNTFIDSDLVKNGVSFLTGIVDALDKVIDTLGTLGTIATGITIFELFKKNSGYISIFRSELKKAGVSFSDFSSSAKIAGSSLKTFASSASGIISIAGLVVTAISAIIQAYNNYKEEQAKARQETIDTANTFLDSVDTFEQVYVKYSGKTSLTADEENELKSAIDGTIDALGGKSSAIQNVIDKNNDYIGSLEDVRIAEMEAARNEANKSLYATQEQLLDMNPYVTFKSYRLSDAEKEAQRIVNELLPDLVQEVTVTTVGGRGNATEKTRLMPLGWDNSVETIDELVDYYFELIEARNTIDEAALENPDLLGTDMYTDLNTVIDSLSASVEEYLTQQYNLAKYNYEIDNGIPKTVEEYNAMREAILGNIDASEQYKNVIASIMDEEWGQIFDLNEIENATLSAAEKKEEIQQKYLSSNEQKIEDFDFGVAKDQYQKELDFNSWLDSLSDDELEIVYNITLNTDTAEWDLKNWQRELDKYYDANSKFTDEQIEKVTSSFKDNSIIEWFNELTPGRKQLVYEIGVRADDTSLWTLDRWKQELVDMEAAGLTTEESLQSFYDTINNTDDGNFKDRIEGYISEIDTLKEVLDKIASGDFTEADMLDLAWQFPELQGKTGDIDTLTQAIQDLIGASEIGIDEAFAAQIEAVGGEATSAGQALLWLQGVVKSSLLTDASGFGFDIDAEIEKFDNFYKAINESVSGTGLSTESIKNIESMYSSLEGYDPSKLFEKTEHGIHLNVQELRDLQSEYENLKKQDIQSELEDLKQEYNNVKKRLEGLTEGTEEYDRALSELNGIEQQIQDVQTLAAQYEGLTSSYNKWLEAQSTKDEDDMYNTISDSIDDVRELYESGRIGTDDFRAAVQLMTDEDLSTAPVEKLLEVYDIGMKTMKKFFTGNSDGLLNFLNMAEDVTTQLGEDWVTLDEDGNWHIDFGVGGDEEFVKAFNEITGLQLSTEELQALLRGLSAYGFDVNLDSAYTSLEQVQSKVEKTEYALQSLGEDPVDINIYCDDEDLDSEIEKAQNKIDEIENSDVEPEVKAAQLEDANAKYEILLERQAELGKTTYINIDSTTLDDANQKLIDLGKTKIRFNFDTTEISFLDTQIKDAQSLLDEFKNDDGTVNLELEGAKEAQQVLAGLIAQRQELNTPSIMSVDTSQATTDIENAIGLLQDYQTNYNNLEINTAVGTDTSQLETDIETQITAINNLSPEIKASLGLDSEEFQTACDNVTANITAGVEPNQEDLDTINTTIGAITPEIMVEAGIDSTLINGYTPEDENATVVFDVDSSAVDTYIDELENPERTVTFKKDSSAVDTYINGLEDINKTVTYTVKINGTVPNSLGVGGVDGTAHARGSAYAGGTVGKAYKQGDWGTKDSGTALMGELGPELLVRNGKYYVVGEDSAEFVNYKKGDIIFNAEQTQEIFEKGKITHGNGRGRALAEGTISPKGNAFSDATGGFYSSGNKVTTSSSSSKKNTKKKSSSKSSSNKETAEDTVDEFEETFDWIEIAIDRVERAISRLDLKVNSTYRTWSARNKALKSEISKVGEEISIQQQAYNRYLQEAESVGLDESYASKVRNGEINIELTTDEDLKEKIDEYQEW